MLDSKQIKGLGLRFARALQMTIKTAGMFTVEHQSVERPIQQSFQHLNTLLKEVGQFTFGFVDNQVMLNNLLTTDASLQNLETEFLKRGVAAVTFEPGLTLGRYKKVIYVLSVSTKVMDGVGGLLPFLDANEVEGARILPAARNQKKDEHGDTIIETDSEAYILSKQMSADQAPRDFLDSIDALLESGCFDPSTRADVLSDFAARGMDGSGYGVPVGVSNLVVVNEGEKVVSASDPGVPVQASPGGGGSGTAGTAGQSGFTGSGESYAGSQGAHPGPNNIEGANGHPYSGHPGASTGRGGHSGHGGYSGPAPTGIGIGVGVGSGAAAAPAVLPGLPRNLAGAPGGSFMELVEASVQRSLLEEKGDPHRSYTSLARILRNMGVDKILAQFPAERRDELVSLPPEQLAAEYIEDTALQLAGEKLKSASGNSQKILIEEDVVRVLARSLQATQMADRLVQKLAKFIEDFAVPAHVQEKIREELTWNALNGSKRFARLMELKHYSVVEFRRLMELLKELVTHREIDRATALAGHYFDFLDEEGAQIDVMELSRAPELIRSIPLAQIRFASKTAERLGRTLQRSDVSDFVHTQVASALTVLAQSIAAFEDFETVLAIGVSLETSLKRDREKHKKCCGIGLSRLLPASATERIIEMFLHQRNDSAWSKTSATLLRYAAPASIESVFAHLIDEQDARNRMALLRLVGQLGRGAIEVAYKYLKDERWYVVRNICGVLAELKDHDLADHIVPALTHSDERVQQAALKALVNSRTVRAAPVLADALSKLAPKVQDEALDELTFLRHVKTIHGLEEFVIHGGGTLPATKKAVQVLAAIDEDESLEALDRLARTEELDSRVRRIALGAITRNASSVAVKLLQNLADSNGPFTDEIRAELKSRSERKK